VGYKDSQEEHKMDEDQVGFRWKFIFNWLLLGLFTGNAILLWMSFQNKSVTSDSIQYFVIGIPVGCILSATVGLVLDCRNLLFFDTSKDSSWRGFNTIEHSPSVWLFYPLISPISLVCLLLMLLLISISMIINTLIIKPIWGFFSMDVRDFPSHPIGKSIMGKDKWFKNLFNIKWF
jgi:hypothetical protein